MPSIARAALTLPIRLWQWTARPLLGPNCRFLPSCSDYALVAIEQHGLRGLPLAAGRILRCNPWCEGGHDPVPTRLPRTAQH